MDPTKARQWYEQALEIARRLVALEPENTSLIQDALYPCLKLAELARQAEDSDADRHYTLEALELAQQGIQTDPDDADLYYSLACAHARLGRTDEALDALARHVELGGSDADWTAQDPDFASIRDLPAFHDLLDLMRRNADSP